MANGENPLASTSGYISGVAFHVGIEVPDLDEARKFYCDILGFKESWTLEAGGEFLESITGLPDPTAITVQLEVPGGSRIELQQYTPQGSIGESRINNQGLNHLSFGVTDVQAAYEYLKSAGVSIANEPVAIDMGDHPMSGYSVFYFDDPWGTTLEILGPTPGKSPKTLEVIPG